MEKSKAKKTALFGLSVALAFTLSYLESLLPFNFGIPGVKLGLANLVVVIALYRMKPENAFIIAIIRILLAGFTFGNTVTLVYSICGGLLSFTVMLLARKTRLSVTGVSVLGGVFHNIGQLGIAAVLMHTKAIMYYIPVLLISGTVTGLLLGVASSAVINRLEKTDNKSE